MDAPHFYVWLGSQHRNTDPSRAAAAAHIQERWQLSEHYNHARTLRTLRREDSEHLLGALALTDDYATQFGLDAAVQVAVSGATSPLIPILIEQCQHVTRAGKLCGREAIPATARCGYHGGQWVTDDERAAVVREVSGRLVDVATRAVQVLTDLMDNARSEKVRLDAALAVLDRVGVGPVSKLELDVTASAEDAAAEIRSRLLRLAVESGEVVEGETVANVVGTADSEVASG